MQRFRTRRGLIAGFAALVVSFMFAAHAFAGEATLSWTAPATNTNGSQLADLTGYKVYYGTASGSYSNIIDVGNVTSYKVANLSSGTTYYFAVTAYNSVGTESAYSNEATKTIQAADTAGPVISGVYASNITPETAGVNWVTDEPSDSQIEYGTTASYGYKLPLNDTMVTAHSETIEGLAPSTLYHYKVLSRDASGNITTSADYTFTTDAASDVTSPVISNVAVSGITGNSATITWSTDEPATSQVEYGSGNASALDSELVTIHSVHLTGLNGYTSYDFVVRSADIAGNLAISSYDTFNTSNIPPAITAYSANTLTGKVPLLVTLSASATDTDGSISTYEWDFDGDGIYDKNTGTVSSVSTTYSTVGTYNAKVKVTDSGGTSVISDALTVSADSSTNKPPVVISIVGTISQNGPSMSITFHVTASDPNGSIVKFEWDFDGNGTIDAATSTAPAQFVYSTPGTYYPTVTVTDDQGGIAKGVASITVEEEAQAAPAPATSTSGSSSSGGSGGGCFIATAAYGSYLEPEVMVLRQFRDNILLTNPVGKAFVSTYYRLSPPAAEFIVRHENLRTATRLVLTPIVYGIKYPQLSLAFVAMAAGMVVVSRRKRR
ncbi:MAG: fibronectin type III domain-containing protein [Deltaproteobacteria bacterium]|nr:fibronectin type III domain-containing protein [Deltaproteobacteria bacterium]